MYNAEILKEFLLEIAKILKGLHLYICRNSQYIIIQSCDRPQLKKACNVGIKYS